MPLLSDLKYNSRETLLLQSNAMMFHLKVQPLVSQDRISYTDIQTTEMVIIKNAIDYSSAKFSLSIKSLSLNPSLHKVVLTVTCTSYIMHIACPAQSALKEVLGE